MWAKVLLLSALIAGNAVAAPVEASDRAPAAVRPPMLIQIQNRERPQTRSVWEIVRMLRERFGGDMVGYQLVDGPRPTYLIRWRMPNDEYRDFQVDAVSGQIR